jgi:beta-lactamase class A
MNQTKQVIGWIFVLLTLIFALVLFVRTLKIDPQTIITPVTEKLVSLNIPNLLQKQQISNSLKDVVQKTLSGKEGTYGIVIKNLKTGETYESNKHEVFQSGSLYKLWAMATAYDQIKNGVLHEDDVMKQEIPILNEKFKIATEDAERTEGDITLSVADALFQMITISDNYSALLLSEKVRLSNVAKFLNSHGFSESKVGTDGSTPVTTPSDIALFFEKLYKGTLIDGEYDEKMLDLLKEQQLNNKIPKNLPENIMIAHKTGEFNYFTHDGGIVYTPKGDYIIVILSESRNPMEAEQTIADVSETVYTLFTR